MQTISNSDLTQAQDRASRRSWERIKPELIARFKEEEKKKAAPKRPVEESPQIAGVPAK